MDNKKFCVGGSKIVIEFHHQIFAGYSSLEINVAKNLSLINNSQAQTTVTLAEPLRRRPRRRGS